MVKKCSFSDFFSIKRFIRGYYTSGGEDVTSGCKKQSVKIETYVQNN